MTEIKYDTVTFIGAGKVAHSVVPALLEAGVNVLQIISRNLISAKELAVRNKIKSYSDSLNDLPGKSNLIFLSVPDNEIKKTADRLAELNTSLSDKLFIHFSGAYDLSALNTLKSKGSKTASIHIMHSFPGRYEVKLNNHYAAVEADCNPVKEFLLNLCSKINLKPFPISSEAKVYYHLMGVFTLNFECGNFYNAELLRKKINGSIPEAKDLLYEAASGTLQNIHKNGAVQALSGPVERGDLSTIEHHINSMKDDKLLLLNYISASLTLLETALEKKSISTNGYDEIKIFLVKKLQLVAGNYLNS